MLSPEFLRRMMPLVFHHFMGDWANSIIAGKKEQGVLIEPSLFEGIINLPNYPVHLHQEISVGAESALARKLFHRYPGLVRDGGGVVQKERFIRFLLGMILNDFYCPFHQRDLPVQPKNREQLWFSR